MNTSNTNTNLRACRLRVHKLRVHMCVRAKSHIPSLSTRPKKIILLLLFNETSPLLEYVGINAESIWSIQRDLSWLKKGLISIWGGYGQ